MSALKPTSAQRVARWWGPPFPVAAPGRAAARWVVEHEAETTAGASPRR